MKIYKSSFLLLFILVLSLLAGCSMPQVKKDTAEEIDISKMGYKEMMTYYKGKAVEDTLSCWYTEEEDKVWLETAAKSFTDKYNINVNLVYYDGVNFFEDMNQANQANKGPDMYLVGNDELQLAKESGMAVENTMYSDSFWEENYPEVAKNAVTFQEKQYGYPVYFDTYCLVYDANLMENAPASIDDILTFLDEYEDSGSTKAVFRWDVADPYINSMFLASYANLFGENGDDAKTFKVNDENSIAAMQYFQSLSAYLWMDKSNISHDTVMNRIKDGTLVLGLCKSDILPTLYEMQQNKAEESTQVEGDTEGTANTEENSDKGKQTNYQISYVPSLTAELSSTTFSTTYDAMVNPYAKDEALGHMFGMFLSYENASNQYAGNGKLPVINQKDNFDGMQAVIYAQYLNSKPIPKVMVLGDYITQSGIAFDAIWQGKDVKEQLDTLQSVMEEKIK